MSFRNYYDTSSYGRRDAAKSSSDRPTSVTAKYTTTPSYKSSSIPVLSNEKEKEKESPITAIANKYASYNKTEKPTSKYDKKDYSKLSVPSLSTNKSRDPSPVTTSKYSLPRPSRHLSPERRTTKSFKDKSRDTSPSDRDKDIPSKTDKSSYNSLSSYKIYPRSSSYTRPSTRSDPKPDVSLSNYRPSRADNKPDISVSNYTRPYSRADTKSESTLSNYSRPPSRTDPKSDISSSYSRPSSRAENKPEITVNRYAIANRLSSNYLRSPTPTTKRSSVSPVNHIEVPKKETEKSVSPVAIIEEPCTQTDQNNSRHDSVTPEVLRQNEDIDGETETVTIVTRHTSPTPPGSSSYVRSRRADMAKTIEKTITRLKRRPETVDKEIQSDRLDDPTRTSRFGSTARTSMSNWSYYSPNTHYTGYAGRYSTQYSNLSPPTTSYDRSSRSRSREPQPKDISSSSSPLSENIRERTPETNNNPEIITSVYEQDKGDDTSEIIINVNLKLKRAKSPSASELVSPEITITNSQLPPQAPKAEGNTKVKKSKVRKSSTDSSSDSGTKKKVVKKRSKSVSSTDSDHASEASDKVTSSKSIPKTSSSNNLVNGQSKLKHSKSRESNSPESSVTLSTQSSISEDETISKSKDLSRTSADEKSLSMDRSGRQPSPLSQKNENGTEEAKSFLIRALAPVTNLFKMRQPDSSENSRWLESSTSESTSKDVSNLITESDKSNKSKSNSTNNIVASNDDNMVQFKGIRPLESGERAWWLDSESGSKLGAPPQNDSMKTNSDKNLPRKIRHIESGERAWWLDSNSDNKSSNHAHSNHSESDSHRIGKKQNYGEEEKPWWLDSSANIPEGIERLTPPRKSSSESEKSEKFNFFKVRHIESGEKKDWWLTSNENSLSSNQHDSQSLSKSASKGSFPVRRIRHVESGERPWWLCSDENIPEGIEKLPPPSQEESESSDSEEVQVYTIPAQVPPFPLQLPDDEPLGDRRSPEGLETPNDGEEYRNRSSPYENSMQYRRRSSANSYAFKNAERFISRFTDIDDILGTSGQIYSPFMDSILARRTGQLYDDEHCEEIDPTQVRIHDSTPQRPVIKKIRSRSDIIDCRDEDQLDDATLQVFKDGEYGPYLDLDSTLAEQYEELEGLQDNRKNALVLRTQLSVRVHAIIERLLQSQGRELRRALFALKQILQSDKDLVHEFVASKGLDCLMEVGNKADHNYLDFILRALGQILLYVDGMHGVMSHKRCVQWLYSLLFNKSRLVVKTALKLLMIFVEYTEQNSLLLIDAIVTVDGQNGVKPWYNIMKILQDVDASDTELLIYAATLINRCLNNVPDRDTYYDQVDALQEQGIDDIIQLYMNKQGTDLDFLRQLHIFESVLQFEDGDETGTALKQLDESVVKSVRRRSLNLSSADRRRSKKQLLRENAKPRAPEPEPKPRASFLPSINDSIEKKELTTALKRRRDRFARQQEMLNNSNSYNSVFTNGTFCPHKPQNLNSTSHTANGTLTNGTLTNGTLTNGTLTNGTLTNGTLTNGTLTNGTLTNASSTGTLKSGSTNGIHTNGTTNSMPTKGSATIATPAIGSKNGMAYSNMNGTTHASCNGVNGTGTKYGPYGSTNSTTGSTNGNIGSTNGNNGNTNDTNGITNGNNGITNGPIGSTNGTIGISSGGVKNEEYASRGAVSRNLADLFKNGNQRYTSGLKQRIQNGTLGHSVTPLDALTVIRQKQLDSPQDAKDDRGIILNREHSIKDLAQRLTTPVSPTTEEKPIRVSEMAGIVSKAKEELAKSQSKEVIKSPTIEKSPKVIEIKISENDLHWEELRKGCLNREFHLCDLDFSDLKNDSDDDVLSPAMNAANGPPPPPPGFFPPFKAPPPLPSSLPLFPTHTQPPSRPPSEKSNKSDSSSIKKNKKTVKLFWKEIQENPAPPLIMPKVGGFIWDDLPDIKLDTAMLEHLFESRTNDLIIKKLMEPKRNLILDTKRSNAINIAMKKLPSPQTIKASIMKMDATVIGREGIDKLLTMLPTEEEKVKIQEAQYANPDLPLGSAEQFLLALASINELASRLKLWVFKLDFDNLEKEIAEPLMDLKHGIELLKTNRTFKVILSTLRSVGSFLNGSAVKGFRLEYLSKVMEVKDTVHKHPLLYHICEMIIEKFPETTDFFSEVGPVIRASKVDFDNLNVNLQKLESDCKASWDHMKRVAKHDSSQIYKTKINEFLTDAAERIILLSVIKKRVMARYNKFLLYLGVPLTDISKTKPSEFLKVIAEFALEYRTTRERVLQQLEKRANHRERNKTRGKMIIDTGNYSNKNGEHAADSALKELLKTDPDTDSLTKGRRKAQPLPSRSVSVNGDLSADEEIIESLVRSVTSKRRQVPREPRKNRISDKKLWKRSLDGTQSWPGRENNAEANVQTPIQQR